MLNLRASLRTAITEAIARAQDAGELPAGPLPDVIVEYPPERGGERLGEYASPVSLVLGKRLRTDPMRVAETIAKHFTPPEFVGKGEVIAPGFLNFHVDPSWLSSKLNDLIEEGLDLAHSDEGAGTTVNLEFVSANPTGLPHVGNGRALFSADVLGNVLARAGYAVTREYYVNDVGVQVDKYGESVLRRILEAAGHPVEFPEGLYPGDDVRGIATQVQEEMVEDRGHVFSPDDLSSADLRAEVTRRAVDVTVREIRRLLETVAGVTFDVWFRESTLHARGDIADVIQELKKRGHTAERDGALWLTSTTFGDDKDRVLVRAQGEPTYLLTDIAYHREKFRRGFHTVIDFWGADHHGHVVPLRAGLEALGEDPHRLHVALVQIVRVVEGGEAKKLSKREGTAVPLGDVLSLIGLSAARFFLTVKPLTSPFDFDLDLARAQKEENPVYYVQYAYVRLASILRRAKQQNLADGEVEVSSSGASLLSPRPLLSVNVVLPEPAELRMLALALRLPEVLQDIVRTWEVQRLPQYALELAAVIHRFYDTVPVLKAGERDLLHARLVLVSAVRNVLGTVFDLLDIEKREVM